jgi:hypothetical protein
MGITNMPGPINKPGLLAAPASSGGGVTNAGDIRHGVSNGTYTGDRVTVTLGLGANTSNIWGVASGGTQQDTDVVIDAALNPGVIWMWLGTATSRLRTFNASSAQEPNCGYIYLWNHPYLTSVQLPSALSSATTQISLVGNALPQAGTGGVDAILAAIAAVGAGSTLVDISGGTNAQPSHSSIGYAGDTFTRTNGTYNGYCTWHNAGLTAYLFNDGAGNWVIATSLGGTGITIISTGRAAVSPNDDDPCQAASWSIGAPTWTAGQGMASWETIFAGATTANRVYPLT